MSDVCMEILEAHHRMGGGGVYKNVGRVILCMGFNYAKRQPIQCNKCNT